MRGCLPRVSSARALVSVTVRATIESTLGPNTVAVAARVSYANAVLAEEGKSGRLRDIASAAAQARVATVVPARPTENAEEILRSPSGLTPDLDEDPVQQL